MKYRGVKLTLLVACALLWGASLRLSSTALSAQRRTPSPPRRRAAPASRPDYANFSHRVAAHRQACDACHKFPTANWKEARPGDAAFPDVTDYPQHASCLNCHRQQFFSGARPVICTVCHRNPSPRDGTRHPFPNPAAPFLASPKGREAVSDFAINFPHETHKDVVSRALSPPGGVRLARVSWSAPQEAPKDGNCSVCHQTYQPQGESDEEFVRKPPQNLPENAFWLKKGTFKTSPADHASCFSCHSPESGLKPAPTDCATCHVLTDRGALPPRADFDPAAAATMQITDAVMLRQWRRRDSSATFRHEFVMHADLACADCHRTATMNTAEAKTLKVPVLSCGGAGSGCHIEPTADGLLNTEIAQKRANPTFACTKCHQAFGRQAIPQSHLDAIAAAAKAK